MTVARGGTEMAKGALIAAMDFTNVAADEFNDWYDSDISRAAASAGLSDPAAPWIGADNPKQSVATYDLESLACCKVRVDRAIGGENLSRGRSG